jgi:hypothetical protein
MSVVRALNGVWAGVCAAGVELDVFDGVFVVLVLVFDVDVLLVGVVTVACAFGAAVELDASLLVAAWVFTVVSDDLLL